MKITKVYTKTGDEGLTSLVGGYRVSKTNARIEAYGTVDELSANLGVLASYMKDGDDKTLIIRTQDRCHQLQHSTTDGFHPARRLARSRLRSCLPHRLPKSRTSYLLYE